MVDNIYQVINEDDIYEILDNNRETITIILSINTKYTNSALVKKLKLNLFKLAQNNLKAFFCYVEFNNYKQEKNKLLDVTEIKPVYHFYFSKKLFDVLKNPTLKEINNKLSEFMIEIENYQKQTNGTPLNNKSINEHEISSNNKQNNQNTISVDKNSSTKPEISDNNSNNTANNNENMVNISKEEYLNLQQHKNILVQLQKNNMIEQMKEQERLQKLQKLNQLEIMKKRLNESKINKLNELKKIQNEKQNKENSS